MLLLVYFTLLVRFVGIIVVAILQLNCLGIVSQMMTGSNQNPFVVGIEIQVEATVAQNIARYRNILIVGVMNLFLKHCKDFDWLCVREDVFGMQLSLLTFIQADY